MAVKKIALLTGVIATVGLASIAAINVASAQSGSSNGNTIVDKISQKFNLNKTDVQKVFDEDKQTHVADMQAKYSDKLTQAVKDGKITEDQKTKLIAKEAEMQTFMQSLKDKTPAERKTAMDAKKAEIDQWLKDSNISSDFLPALGMHGKMGGHGMMPGEKIDKDNDGN